MPARKKRTDLPEKTRKISVVIDGRNLERLFAICDERGLTISDVLRRVLDEYFEDSLIHSSRKSPVKEGVSG